jgi:hypothetical protein
METTCSLSSQGEVKKLLSMYNTVYKRVETGRQKHAVKMKLNICQLSV